MNKSAHTIDDLNEEGVLKSFENLVEQFNLANDQFWRYPQLRHLISTLSAAHTPQGLDLIKGFLHVAETGHGAWDIAISFQTRYEN